ncbi:MAG: hypothetical protein Q9170_001202 [Blastenia crenularia]
MVAKNRSEEYGMERKIIMAVDFGTTFSGLAWAQTRKPENQSTVIQWPDATSGGLEGATSDKVPTMSAEKVLRLDPAQARGTSNLAVKYPDPNAAPPAYGRGSEELVKDYLTALRTHAERILRHKLPQSALASTAIEFVITVPAVWSDRAQASTRRCAEMAGMGKGSSLHMITEPEAAAMYALDAMDPHNIKVGDTFVLCDAGGGTVDLISYKVSALKPVLQITEAAPGSGSLCGSTFLNRIFHKFLVDKLSNDPNWDDDVLEEAMKRFEVTIFEPVIKEVIALVEGQIKATKAQVKAVLMVGGFGQSVYLRDRLRQAIAPRGIELMQSPNGWTAVVRGALMKGLISTNSNFTAVNISGRFARKSYGIEISRRFEEGKDDMGRRVYCPFEGDYYIVKMDWFIKKGDTVTENKPQRLSYTQNHCVTGPPPSLISMPIYTCTETDDLGPSTYLDARARQVVTVSADLSRIPLYQIPKAVGADGLQYFEIDFQFEVTYWSGYTTYELVYNSVNYGPVVAEYV